MNKFEYLSANFPGKFTKEKAESVSVFVTKTEWSAGDREVSHALFVKQGGEYSAHCIEDGGEIVASTTCINNAVAGMTGWSLLYP
jgi:hypothetical protein